MNKCDIQHNEYMWYEHNEYMWYSTCWIYVIFNIMITCDIQHNEYMWYST